ncbi:MAG: tetratricopeptide repeat protein [Anaerolineae bacterium]|nr:tetratricopeptide repeat protein [Anaerolineae bacterium]
MARLSIYLLGGFHVTLDGEAVTAFESSKVRALLAYLALEADAVKSDRPHSRDALAALLWPDQSDQAARRNLSQALFNLRQVIHDDEAAPPFLEITRATVQFNRDSDHWLDVAQFATYIEAGEWANLQSAVELYRGEFLAGFFVDDNVPFAEWGTLLRERYHQQVLDALYRLTEYHEQRRDYERARHYARRQVELEPWQEEAHRQLIRLLARSGQRSAALRQYETCRRTLADELGVEPHEETTALYERIRAAGAARPHNLPDPPTPFVGRRDLLQQIAHYLEHPACRLLTLLGPGGIGKTRLALQAAREALDAFLNGVWYIPLSSVNAVEFLVPTVADGLGLRFSGSRAPSEQLADYLREKELLLVLDSLEHLLEGADWLVDVLHRAPGVKILVTSRERLNLRAEYILDVPGLAYPAGEQAGSIADYEAVQLFLQHAVQVRADFGLSPENQPHVARVCQLLEGIPLGVELAASWVRTLPCEQIIQEMQHAPDFLATSLRDVPARHKSLRAVFQHSWKLLAEVEQKAVSWLSVFHAPFRDEAAQAVTGVEPATLLALSNKSLLSRRPSGRYDFHALLKQYAAEELAAFPGEESAMRESHCRYYVDFLQQRESDLRGGRQMEAQAEIGTEIEDVRVAWEYALASHELDAIARSLEGLYLFYRARGRFQEGRDCFGDAAAAVPVADEAGRFLQARLQARQADFHSWLGDYDAARALLQQSLTVFEPFQFQRECAFALEVLGRMAYYTGAYAQAQQHLQASVVLYRQVEDPWGAAQALNYWGNVVCSVETGYGEAMPLYEESLALSQQIGDQAGIARALSNLGAVEHCLEHYPAARQLYHEALTISREIGDRQLLAIALGNLGNVAYRCGEYDQALELMQESLDIKRGLGNRPSMMYTMNYLGNTNRKAGHYHEARRWYDQALRLAHDLGATAFMSCVLASIAALLAAMGDAPRAAELIQVALDHADGDQDVIAAADQLRPVLEAEIGPQAVATCSGRGRGRPLEQVVAGILAGGWYDGNRIGYSNYRL